MREQKQITELDVRIDRLKAAVAKAKRLAKGEKVVRPRFEVAA